MRTQDERVRQLHIRAAEMQKLADQRKTTGLASLCMGILAILILSLVRLNHELQNAVDVDLQGSSLLSESAGGYILTAVLAFFAGVIVTVLLFRYRNKSNK